MAASPDPEDFLDFAKPPARAAIHLGSKVTVQPAIQCPSVSSHESKAVGVWLLPVF